MNKVDVKIVATRKRYLGWSFRPTSKRKTQLSNGAITVKKEKCRVNLNTTRIRRLVLERTHEMIMHLSSN